MVTSNFSARLRSGALLLGATATLGLAACGGDDGGDKEEYETALNSFCGALLDKQKTLESDVQKAASGAASDPTKATGALADVLKQYGGTLTSELDKLDDTEAPEDYKEFATGLESGITKVAEIANETAGKLEKVDLSGVKSGNTEGLEDLQKALTGLQETENPLENLEAPEELQKAAPRCEELSNS